MEKNSDYDKGFNIGRNFALRSIATGVISKYTDISVQFEREGKDFLTGLDEGYRFTLNELYYNREDKKPTSRK